MLRHAMFGTALFLATTTAFAAVPDDATREGLQRLASQTKGGTLGAIVMDPSTGTSVSINNDRRYVMMSMFKAPVAAAVLDQVDHGKLRLDQKVHLVPADRLGGSAVPSLGDRLEKQGAFDTTIDELLHASVTQSDNTAVDALLRVLGGGPTVTTYLEAHGVQGIRVDMGERGVSAMFEDLRPGEEAPADETDAQTDARRRRGYAAVLASDANTATLDGAATFLRQLQAGKLLSPASTQTLLGLMTSQAIPNRIRAGLPAGFQFADKTGTGASNHGRMSAFNDIGIITAPDGRKLIVALYLRDSGLSIAEATKLFAEAGKLLAHQMM